MTRGCCGGIELLILFERRSSSPFPDLFVEFKETKYLQRC